MPSYKIYIIYSTFLCFFLHDTIKILPEIKNKDKREQEAILHILSFGFWKNMSFFSKKKNKEIEDILLFNLKKHLKKR